MNLHLPLKFQKIRSCVQCGGLLPLKCSVCLKHPDRKPKEIILYGLPSIIKTAECGCLLISCERPGCTKTRWTLPHNARIYKNHFCSIACANMVIAASRRTRETVTCLNPQCDKGIGETRKMFEIKPSNLKGRKGACCCPACHWIYKKLLKEGNKEEDLAIRNSKRPKIKVITAADIDNGAALSAPKTKKPIEGYDIVGVRGMFK